VADTQRGDQSQAEGEPAKGVVRWLVSCDESGVHGAKFYAFGTLWMSWQRRGDFAALVRELRDTHDYRYEIKWRKVNARTLSFYEDLVEEFFKTTWLTFHSVVVERSVVRKELHGGDYDVARRKHFTMLLNNKISACLRARPGREQTFRIVVDPIHSRYPKADEAAEVICNRVLAKAFGGRRPVDRVFTRDSRETPSIQLCDLLLGAVTAAWEQDASSDAKLELRRWIAAHLGWSDLRADTIPSERKFNVWMFHDPTRGPRRARSRPVVLRYPLSPK
jgi:hypothetical protein